MFLPFSRFRKSRSRKQAESLVKKGINLLQGNLQHKALFQFQQAIEIDPDIVGEMLYAEFEKSHKRGDDELSLSIGRIVLKIRVNDFELANKLGNCARKLKKYKEANEYYRQAFRINRNYEIAFYNLAASMGRIPRFNNDVKELVDQFSHINAYVLPHYKLNQQYLELIIQEIKSEQSKAVAGIVRQDSNTPSYTEICDYIRKQIKAVAAKDPSANKQKEFESQVFNLGLFALSRKDCKLALKCFLQLKKRNCQLEYLDLVIILAMDLESPSKKLVEEMMLLLAKDKTNRYLNVNLGIMFRKQGKRILAYKYLATTALLLEKSGGIYCRMELVRMADQEMELGNLKKALRIYQLVNSEIENIQVKSNIGQILLYQSRYSEALPIFQEILAIDPAFPVAKQKLMEIHDYFLEKGEELVEIKKYTTALPYFEQALTAARLPETVKKMADLYRQMMDTEKAETLYNEYKATIQKSENTEGEETRLAYIQQGKELLLKKEYQQATELFEKAFLLKVDKDVFVFLAHIYKVQKRTKDLQNLMMRWKEKINQEGIRFEDI